MHRALSALSALLFGLSLAFSARAEIRGLVVGIDRYAFVSDLAGAVNDARDLAGAIEARGGRVTLILDAEATRARILGTLEDIATRARPGDAIIFSYAGHGAQLPEALPGDETDGLDETYILHGFEVNGPGFDERIRDNDIAAVLARVHPDVSVLVIADSCHSGTMTRAVDSRGALGATRFLDVGVPATRGALPPPDPATRGADAGLFANVVFANAARDDQTTPEVRIDGVFRGALSWSVARAMRGAAKGGDDQTSLGDFRDFVIEQVRALSGTRQTPGVSFRAGEPALARLGALFDGFSAAVAAPSEKRTKSEQLGMAKQPTVFVRSDAPVDRAVLVAGMRLAKSEEMARMLWDRTSGELVDRATADVIAEADTEVEIVDAVLKWRTVQPLLTWAPMRPLEFRLIPDDRRYRVGDEIYLEIARPAAEFHYLTIVNLASTGEVQFVYPAQGHVAANEDRFSDGESGRRLGPAPVVPPTGADHVLAIASTDRLTALHETLETLHGSRAPQALLRAIEVHAGDPANARIGLLPIFTER